MYVRQVQKPFTKDSKRANLSKQKSHHTGVAVLNRSQNVARGRLQE